jgi:hypothetical protein
MGGVLKSVAGRPMLALPGSDRGSGQSGAARRGRLPQELFDVSEVPLPMEGAIKAKLERRSRQLGLDLLHEIRGDQVQLRIDGRGRGQAELDGRAQSSWITPQGDGQAGRGPGANGCGAGVNTEAGGAGHGLPRPPACSGT